MLYLLGLIFLFILIIFIFRNTSTWEGWHNYNIKNHYNNMFGLFPNFRRTPYQDYNTEWSSGIYSLPHFNTFSTLDDKSKTLYATHQYLSNMPLMGYKDRRSYIPPPPLTLTGINPILR